jgi:hypothetical protein
VMRSLVVLFGKLRLQINKSKSTVDRARYRSFLGFSFWMSQGWIIRSFLKNSVSTATNRPA